MSKQQPYKIIFTGPESTGKTTMSKLSAKLFTTHWLSEYSRDYLATLNRPYIAADLLKIAEGQLAIEKKFLDQHSGQSFLFFDTSFLVLKVWSIFKYGFYNFKLEQLLRQNLPDFYFLCDWQIPWEEDPLRENQHDRAALYALYKKELLELKVPFFELSGTEEERLKKVQKIVKSKNIGGYLPAGRLG